MELYFSTQQKRDVFLSVENYLTENGFIIKNKDSERPWGGFFVIDEEQTKKFIKKYFKEFTVGELLIGRISPKILLVEPGKKLSWQYHHRRAELWKVIGGEAGIITSMTNEETELQRHESGSIIKLQKGERHRLIGLNAWGIIAEIWQHTDPEKPSDENDIIRVQDDFGR
jgi:mannose-6-phosphate isomerase-like protein (cupin superfamily)